MSASHLIRYRLPRCPTGCESAAQCTTALPAAQLANGFVHDPRGLMLCLRSSHLSVMCKPCPMVRLPNPCVGRSQPDISPTRFQMQRSTDPESVQRGLEVVNKRSCLMKQDPRRGLDLFGKQLPLRLLAEALSYVQAKELARSHTVCSGWRR